MKNTARRILLAGFASLLLGATIPAQQNPPMPEHRHPMGSIPTVKPDLPQLGKSQQGAGPRVTLEELERMALERNPTLGMAASEVRAAQGRRTQAGLYPNPEVGYSGEEIRGGSFGGGQHGFFVSQRFVTAGKLGLGRKVFDQEIRLAEIEAEEQRMRVVNGVRMAYYRVLAAQELLDSRKDLLHIAEDGVRTQQRLRNTGQADEAEVLQSEVEQQQHEMAVRMQENALRQAWRSLTAMVGNPALPLTTVEGNLEADLPDLDELALVEALVSGSPAVRIARANVDRARAIEARERRMPIPDIEVRAGLQRNGERLEPSGRATGMQGFAEIGVQIPIFNRNQGEVEAAAAGVQRAEREAVRVELVLRERASVFVEQYRNSRIMVEQYRTQLLPRARKAYELLLSRYGLMTASYPVVLQSQQKLFQMHMEYVDALDTLWRQAITLQGFLLTDGLEAPARPGEMDLPVRETNIPAPVRLRSKEQ